MTSKKRKHHSKRWVQRKASRRKKNKILKAYPLREEASKISYDDLSETALIKLLRGSYMIWVVSPALIMVILVLLSQYL